jgi:acetyl esterase/lipase
MNIEQTMDPELRTGFRQLPPIVTRHPVAARALLKEWLTALTAELPRSDRISVEDRIIPGPIGAPDITIRIYQPATRTSALPGVLYIHGGGFRVGDLDTEDHACRHLIEQVVDCMVISVNYRLAPEHPFPAALEDCYAALKWMTTHAEELTLDLSRVAIRGASAGGGLCAAVALLARDRQEVKLTFQQILYGCLDNRHITSSSYEITDPRTWSRQLSLEGWRAYLGAEQSGEVSPYAAPALMKDLSNLPPTYIMVGELDLLRDETIEYARRLMQAGVPTEFHVYPGGFHAFEATMPAAAMSKRASAEIDEALKRALHR